MDVFSKILEQAVAENAGVGFSARITHKGKDLFRGAAGYADQEGKVPFTCDTVARIFSMTKLVTGVAAMKLFEQGCFALDEPIAKYLPMFKDLKVISYDDMGTMVLRPSRVPLTIRHIFTMTAGFSYQFPTESFEIPSYSTDAADMSRQILMETAAKPNLTSAQMLEAIASIPMSFEPGTGWQYGLCCDILAALVEAVSGKTFGTFLQEELFNPLGMKDTCFRPNAEQLARLAVLYDYSDPSNVVRYDDQAYNIAHSPGSTNELFVGALHSTIDDYTAFLQMISNNGTYEGKRILGAKTIETMTSDQLTAEQRDWLHRTWYPTEHASWGLMGRVTLNLNNTRPYLFPGTFGWGGWAGTQAAVDRVNELTMTLMVQRVPSDSYGVVSKLMQTAYGMI